VTDRKSRSAKRVPDPLTMRRVRWRTDVAEADLTAAFMYLTLLMDDDVAVMIVRTCAVRWTPTGVSRSTCFAPRTFPCSDGEDPHVTAELVRVADGRKLSPVLCLRGNVRRLPVIVAGYHRICASYHCDPTADIVLKLV
jgi:hypothetical protein